MNRLPRPLQQDSQDPQDPDSLWSQLKISSIAEQSPLIDVQAKWSKKNRVHARLAPNRSVYLYPVQGGEFAWLVLL